MIRQQVVFVVNHAPTGISLSANGLPENQPAGTLVGRLAASDPDRRARLAFSFASGSGDADNASFQISGDRLLTMAGYDFETKSAYSVRVRVSDQWGLWREQAFTIAVIDANEAPTDVAVVPASAAESDPPGTLVGTLTAADPDRADSFTFSFVPGTTDNDYFRIVGSTLVTSGPFDYEEKTYFGVHIRATDRGGLSYQRVLTVWITDVADGPGLSIGDVSLAEGNLGVTAATFTLALSRASGHAVPVAYATTNGTATAGVDYQAAGGTIVFAPGETSKQVTVLVNGDTVVEPDETFFIDVAPLANASLARGRGRATIVNDDNPPTVPALSIGDVSVVEGNVGVSSAVFTVGLSAPSAQAVTVDFATADATATAGVDYQAAGGTIVFAPGETSKQVTVLVSGDALLEPDETFTVTLSNPAGATIDDGQGVGTIVNDEAAAVDDAPTAVGDAATVAEDAAATAIDVLANDSDPDGGPKAIDSVTPPANGTVAVTGGGTGLTYQPNANYCNDPPGTSPDTFTYTLTPGGSTATVSVTVTCVADAATAVGDSATVAEDAAATAIDVLANDSDPDGDAFSIGTVTQPGNGTVVVTGGGSGLTYQPNANYCNVPPGTSRDTFTYTLTPGGSTATVSVAVTCVADAATAVGDAATVAEDAAATAIDVLANDSDPDGDAFSIGTVTQPGNGTVVVTGGGSGLTYQPNANYCNVPPGTSRDTFTYTLTPGGSTATVSVTVTCVNDAATVTTTAGALAYTEGDPATAVDGALTVADPDDANLEGARVRISAGFEAGDELLFTNQSGIVGAYDAGTGVLTLTGTSSLANYQAALRSVQYRHTSDNPATVKTVEFRADDGDGLGPAATRNIDVTRVDDPPTAVNDSATVGEDSGASAIDVLANDTDPDGGAKTISSASDPANGTVVLTGGSPGAHTGLTYQPDPNYCNNPPGTTPDTFTYTLNGGSTATVAVTVGCTPDDPVVDTSAGSTSYTENAPATAIDAMVTVTDPDLGATITGATVQITGGFAGTQDILALAGSHPAITPSFSGDTLTLTGAASPAAYQAALRDVTYRNTSDAPSTAARTVTFTVTDDTSRSGSDTKGITVVAVDDPPTAVNDSATVLEDAAATAVPVLTNDTDVDAGPKSIGSVTQPANGTVVITGGGTGLTYQPNPNYCNDPPGTTPSTFTYTLNGGSTATVSMTVTCVNDAPVADDETFNGTSSAVGNTTLVVNDPDDGAPATPDPTDTSPVTDRPHKTITGDILAGDTDIDGPGPLTVTAGTFATNDGGSVTLQADGDFTFEPAASTSCTDTSDFFDYTVSDQNAAGPGPAPGTDTGRVTIAISGCVWYVNNDDAQGNSGTSEKPFDTLAQAETASAAGHTIFVYDGNDTSTGYAAGINLKANQKLIGEAATLTVGSDTLHLADAANKPTITDNNADVVDLDDANEVRGFNIDPQGTGGGIAGSSGDTGGGTIDDVNIVDTGTFGTQPGLELDTTTGTSNISNLTVSTNGATGVRLNSAGTVNFASAGTIAITSNNAAGLIALGGATGTSMGTSVFDAITVTGSGSGGVSLTNTTGTTTFGDLSLTTTSGAPAAFGLANAGTVSVPAAGTANASATGGPAVDVTGTAGAALDFDSVSSTNSANDGINLAGLGTGTFSATGGTIAGAAGISFDLDGGSGAISYPGALNNGSGTIAVEITNRSGGAVTMSGAIADTNDAGGGISLAGNTGGSTTFSNASKVLNTTTSDAISFTTSDGHTLNLTGGGLDIDTTTGRGIFANNSGTLVVSGAGNTIDAVSATALNVTNTDIGAGGATFLRISSGNNTVAADPANGIVLNTTGTSGGLVTTGDGGGANNGSGGVIQSTTGTGISLTSTNNVSLGYVNVFNSGDDGIHGNGITNFTLNRGNVNNNGNSTSDDGIQFGEASGNVVGVLGTLTITSSSVSANAHNGFWVRNTSGTLSSMSVTGSSFNDVNDTFGANAFLFEGSGTSTLTSGTISGSTFQNNTPQRALEIQSHDTATVGTLTVSGNTFVNNGIHASFTQDTSSNLTFKFLNNGTAATPMTGSILQAVNVFSSSQATGGTLVGTISGNRIGNPAVAGSAGGAGAISGVIQGQTDATLLVDANVIRQTSGDARAIGLAFRGPAPPLATGLGANSVVSDLTITNNDVVPGSAPSGFPLSAIMVEADNQTGADNKSPTVRADIRGNSVPAGSVFDLLPTQLGFYEYDAAGAHGIGQLVDTAPASADATAQLTSTNTGSASAFGIALIPGPINTPPP